MKRLFLLRHAKAGFGTTDPSRPLAPRGKADAFWLGQYLKKSDMLPDYILCSSAARARETFDQLQEAVKTPLPATYRDDFYLATAGHMARQIQTLESNINALMIIGHNPGLALLFQGLIQNSAPDRHPPEYPSCSIGILDFDIENWSDLLSNTGQLFDWIIPSHRRKTENG